MECQRCKFNKPDVKRRFFTYGITNEPKEYIICDSCHETLVWVQKQYNPESMKEHDNSPCPQK
jgi:hypothetical protein